jgi:pimeloyl-ACP methyl ester carboxylesterase
VNVVVEGHGPPVVLVHGIGHSHRAWPGVVRDLRATFTTYAVDSPGFGASPSLPPGADASPRGYAEAIARWIEREGLGRPHVAGNSMGGGIALELARLGVAASVTAFAPVGFWSEGERRFARRSLLLGRNVPRPLRPALLRAQGTRAGRAATVGQYVGRPGLVDPAYTRAAFEGLWACEGFERALDGFDGYDVERAHELRGVPVTIAWGTRDRLLLFGPQHRRARERLPWARHVALRTLGHLPMGEDPGACAALVRATAGRVARPPAVV